MMAGSLAATCHDYVDKYSVQVFDLMDVSQVHNPYGLSQQICIVSAILIMIMSCHAPCRSS